MCAVSSCKPKAEFESVHIGNQAWTSENVNITHFQNGDIIPEAKSEDDWINAAQNHEPVWSYYNFDKKYENTYGRMYNWYALTDQRGFAPKGWRVPTLEDWTILINYCGGEEMAANKLKIVGTELWENTNDSVKNVYGFSAAPGGYYEAYEINGFWGIGRTGAWWTSNVSPENDGNAIAVFMSIKTDYTSGSEVSTNQERKSSGFSIRLILDKEIVESKPKDGNGVYTKVMTYKWCECGDYCQSSFIDENGKEYNFGNPSKGEVQFNCELNKDFDFKANKKFKIKFKEYSEYDFSILEITPLEDEQKSSTTTNQKKEENEIITLKEAQLSFLDASSDKVILVLGKPDYSGWLASRKECMVYFNKVNDGGNVKHLVLFASLEKPASPRVVRLLKAVKDGEKAFGGVHYVVINGKKVSTNSAMSN